MQPIGRNQAYAAHREIKKTVQKEFQKSMVTIFSECKTKWHDQGEIITPPPKCEFIYQNFIWPFPFCFPKRFSPKAIRWAQARRVSITRGSGDSVGHWGMSGHSRMRRAPWARASEKGIQQGQGGCQGGIPESNKGESVGYARRGGGRLVQGIRAQVGKVEGLV